MSNIYIQEPPTSGKVLLKTSVGDIDIELWPRECPLACRNFVQLCMEGYYNGTMFHRVVKGFIVQGGDPNGDGTGGESIYGHPFKDEFHSRLRFVRRGLVAMANSGKNDNGSQFFFTLGSTPELQNMHTLFGKVAGDTIYNMLRLEEGEIYENERPHFPHKILKTEILSNPFPDIVPRLLKSNKSETKVKKKVEKGVKNYGLLSFGDEAEVEEEETNQFVQKNITGKSKSSHDVLDDPKLSKQAVDVKSKSSKSKIEETNSSDDESVLKEGSSHGKTARDKEAINEEAKNIRNKLKRKKEESKAPSNPVESSSDSDSDFGLGSERRKEKQEQAAKIREEISKLKKDFQSDKIKERQKELGKDIENAKKDARSEVMKEFFSVQEQYSEKTSKIPKKGSSRENFTLQLLEKFKSKLHNIKDQSENSAASGSQEDIDEEKEIQGDNWLSHRLQFDKTDPIQAKDAVTKDDDWYDVYDPRNPLNKRKRGETVLKNDKPRK
ncbi:spliceosome-associated protein CWC27 homolog [Toxorhynchites rutilus septentrionalis]|uniref:spliceosome-associated protein CWC27 homolog n=1 Tax=Toxorhynchites rutilus septentrionalis TaxID=329112 RepID=UPI0024795F15|nr:spliceosome-associated protein CWC27 homolog [Toxorhynchites rutilus septentrionalis]